MSLLTKIQENNVLPSIIEDVMLFQVSNTGFTKQDLQNMNSAASKVIESTKLDVTNQKTASALLLSLYTHMITNTLNNIDAIIEDANFALRVEG